MTTSEAITKYCDNCIYREKCYRPCPILISAIFDDKAGGQE